MTLVLDEDQSLIRDTAREFLGSRAPITALRALRDAGEETVSASLWQEMSELGWAGIALPEAYGGTGFGIQALGIILEESGRTLSASPLFATAMVGAHALELGASDALKSELLPRVATGELTLALALEESPHHAPWGAELSATADGDNLRLDGAKTFVIDGNVAEELIVVARSSGAAGDRAGLTLVVVNAASEGVTRTRAQTADSRDHASIRFDGVSVPPGRILGEIGQGADVLDPVLDRARAGMAAEMLGSAEEAFERTVEYLKERTQFGAVIGSFQALKHRAADAFTELQLSRSAVMDALSALDEGREDASLVCSLAKARMGDTLNLITREAVQMHGGIGMTDEHEIGFFIKRARVAEAAFGNARWQRDRYASLSGY